MLDHGVERLHEVLRGAVALLQNDDLRIVSFVQLCEALGRAAPEAEDRLVVVAADEEAFGLFGQDLQEPKLVFRDVLELFEGAFMHRFQV